MAGRKRLSPANIAVWILLGLLIVGLAGFGIGDVLRGGLSNTVAEIGDESVSAQEFRRAFLQEINSRARQGEAVSIAEAQAMGLHQLVIGRLAREKAIEAEARRLGLSVSTATVQEEIAAIPAFQGPTGEFSLEQARLALDQARVTEADLRDDVRFQEVAELMQGAIVSGTGLPPGLLQTVLSHTGEQRSFSWLRLDASRFGGDVDPPAEGDLAAFHEANAARYTTPETRVVTYAMLDPAALAATIEIPEEAVREEYEARIDVFRTPERRAVQRLSFPDTETAEAAKARIAAGETTLLALAEERGLAAENIDLGEVTEDALDGVAAEAVFGLETPGIAGPVQTGLGPALFQIDAILSATETSLEEASPQIREALATRRAEARALEAAPEVEDLIAGGATVEEIAAATEYAAGTVEVPVTEAGEGHAADTAFRETALAAEPGIETDLAQTADGSFFVLRVEAVRPAALQPLETIRERVLADWTRARQAEAAGERAEALAERVRAGTPLSRAALGLGLTPAEAGPLRRDAAPETLPGGIVRAVFGLDLQGVATGTDETGAWVAQLASVTSFDLTDPQNSLLASIYQSSFDQAFAQDLFTYFTFAVESRDGLRIYPGVIEAELSMFR